METYTLALAGAATPQVAAALIGGFLGLWYSSKPSKYGWQSTIISGIMGLIAAGAAGDYWSIARGVQSLWFCGVIGMATGMPFGATMDIIRALAPEYAEKIIRTVGDTAIDQAVDGIKNLFSGLKRFFKQFFSKYDTEQGDSDDGQESN